MFIIWAKFFLSFILKEGQVWAVIYINLWGNRVGIEQEAPALTLWKSWPFHGVTRWERPLVDRNQIWFGFFPLQEFEIRKMGGTVWELDLLWVGALQVGSIVLIGDTGAGRSDLAEEDHHEALVLIEGGGAHGIGRSDARRDCVLA